MSAKIFRILGVIGFILGLGSLSACFDETYYPGPPAYSYGSPAYAYPGYYNHYYYAPEPHYYAYNRAPYGVYRHRWEHEEHEEHEWHGHHHRDRD